MNNFQGRYAIRHPWKGPITCKDPRRGIWGGPPSGVAGDTRPEPAVDLAFAPRGKVQLATFVKGSLPEVVALPGSIEPIGALGVVAGAAGDAGADPSPAPEDAGGAAPDTATEADAGAPAPSTPQPTKRGCGCDLPGAAAPLPWGAALAAAGALLGALRRRRRT